MAKRNGAKQKALQYVITDFAIELGSKGASDKAIWNRAWHKLWCRIAKLNIFHQKKGNK